MLNNLPSMQGLSARFEQILGRLSADYLADKHFIAHTFINIQLALQIISGSLSTLSS
jgi:hypothetical protein